MTQNVGSVDRGIRALLGITILMAGIAYDSWLGLIGIIPLFTAMVGWCPAYTLLGISTKKDNTKQAQMS